MENRQISREDSTLLQVLLLYGTMPVREFYVRMGWPEGRARELMRQLSRSGLVRLFKFVHTDRRKNYAMLTPQGIRIAKAGYSGIVRIRALTI